MNQSLFQLKTNNTWFYSTFLRRFPLTSSCIKYFNSMARRHTIKLWYPNTQHPSIPNSENSHQPWLNSTARRVAARWAYDWAGLVRCTQLGATPEEDCWIWGDCSAYYTSGELSWSICSFFAGVVLRIATQMGVKFRSVLSDEFTELGLPSAHCNTCVACILLY